MVAYRLAQLTDLHTTPPRLRPSEWTPKRALGLLSWHLKRRDEHRPEILAAAVADLRHEAADHVAITGDLTNLGSAREIETALGWLGALGGPAEVSLVPGNHDAYARSSEGPAGWRRWQAYMASDAGRGGAFPSVRLRGPLALVGVCSVHPSPILQATGTVGQVQCAALEATLAALGREGWCRVVLIHHPPVAADPRARRRLRDAEAVRRAIERGGAELVLHGHTHREHFATLSGVGGPVPVVGARSSSARGRKPGRAAQYHLYRFERREGARARWRITLDVRAFDGGAFRDAGSRALA
ncbi:MAG TPA: metallophosphoesterase [Myxococcota bacterium]|nr:metallophosphoesterase [Myxococcota bacterium]